MADAWPAVGAAPQRWVHRDPMASRRRRQRDTGCFHSAVVPRIAGRIPDLSPALQEEAGRATADLTRFDAGSTTLDALPFAAVLLRGESASSSQIENLTVRARKLSLAALGAKIGGNAELVARNVAAMQAALAASENLDADALRTMHRELTTGVQHDTGVFREEWVWIGGSSPVTAAYVAPAWEEVPVAVEDLVAFCARRDLNPLVRAAIAHAQFETIHPFTDGNGRTGRALVSALLRADGTLGSVTVPLSSGLLHVADEYIAALTAYRQGAPEPIVRCFVDAAYSSMANARLLIEDIRAFHGKILASRPRVTQGLQAVARLCAAEPAFTAAMVEDLTGVSRATAYRIIDGLTEQGLLIRERIKIAGRTVWSAPELLQGLDRFAERAIRG